MASPLLCCFLRYSFFDLAVDALLAAGFALAFVLVLALHWPFGFFAACFTSNLCAGTSTGGRGASLAVLVSRKVLKHVRAKTNDPRVVLQIVGNISHELRPWVICNFLCSRRQACGLG